MSTHNLCFRAKIGKNVYLCTPQFHYIKVGCKGVFITRTCLHDACSDESVAQDSSFNLQRPATMRERERFEKLPGQSDIGLVVRKPVFGVSDLVRHKPGCTATEDGYRLEVSDVGSRGIVYSIHIAKTKALISCAVTAQLICVFVFAYAKSRFSHNEAHI